MPLAQGRYPTWYLAKDIWVLLWAPNIFAGTPNILGERAKVPFTHLIYKATVTRLYESLVLSLPHRFCFVFSFSLFFLNSVSYFLFLFLCFFSRTTTEVSHTHWCFLSRAPLLLCVVQCCSLLPLSLLLLLVGFIFFQVSYPLYPLPLLLLDLLLLVCCWFE